MVVLTKCAFVYIPGSQKKRCSSVSSKSSKNSSISSKEIMNYVEQLQYNRVRQSTKRNYYTVWKQFNQFFVRLDNRPDSWEDCLTLYVGHLIQNNLKASTIKSYISAIKGTLADVKVNLQEDRFLLNSLTKACRLTNDTVYTRLPIHKNFLALLLREVGWKYDAQPYARSLFLVIFSTMYFGLFRAGEVANGNHTIMARNIHISYNKNKLLFVL